MSSSVSLNTPYAGTTTGSSVSTATTTTTTTTTTTSTSMADTFLTLLVAEIQNQDPTDPTDPTEYVTQLASMAQVAMAEEVATEMNTNAILMSNLQVMALGKMVGDPIMVQTTTLEVSDGAIQGRIDLDDACTQVDIHLTDAIGNDYDIPLTGSAFGPGAVTFSIDPADYGIPPGDYSVSVVTDTGEEEVPVEVAGVVTDVRIPLDGGTPLLNVSGVGEVPFTMISQFGVPDDTPAQDVV
ncbi:flagellar hook capping FlgD N-terminal domain-containing protein [Pseudescherichia sp.]|uniref:flagellar hook capping FlgD N-terminal domain-containing protein n=1 Tax=Pseudescherichia sp. TaxID=2055881 RepID=UPI00289D04B3|nr:flagellar hook capping FlgD N-terminal domain-containing protein [Pseudescherichia sp.]